MRSKNIYFLVVAMVFFIISSCKNDNLSSADESFAYAFEFDQLNFGLDSTTENGSQRFQSFSEDSLKKEYVAFLNQVNATIKIYNLDSLSGPSKTIVFETGQGPNSVGGYPTYFNILNKDSILTYVDFSGGTMTLTDWNGLRIDIYTLPLFENLKTNYLPGFSTSAPLYQLSENQILFPYSVSKNNTTGKSPLFVLDTESGELSYGLENLRFYDHLDAEKIGGKEFFKSAITYNSDQNVYAMILPLDDRVFLVSPEMDMIESYSLPDQDILPFQPLTKSRSQYKSDDRKYLYHRYGNSRYSSIVYDKWKQVYYRILLKGYSKTEIDAIVDQGKLVYSSFKISVFDSNFNQLLNHTVQGSDSLSYNEFFVSSKGLALRQLSGTNEDIMSFGIFNLVNK